MNTRILAYTTTHGSRRFLADCVRDMRATAGAWFDWAVILSGADDEQRSVARTLLHAPGGYGIQHLIDFGDENRGQHHATREALRIARGQDYAWLLRIDDDARSKTKGWLRDTGTDRRGKPKMGMLDRLEWLKEATGDTEYRIIAAPRVLGLRNPLRPFAEFSPTENQPFRAELMPALGGVLRLANTHFLRDFEPNLYDPIGRGDPEQIAAYCHHPLRVGFLCRFPDIRILHPTPEVEAADSPEGAQQRSLSHYWPFLETADL